MTRIQAGNGFYVTDSEDGTVIGKMSEHRVIEPRVSAAPDTDLSSLHFCTSVTGEDQVTVANMRVYAHSSTMLSGLNFYDDENEDITGFLPDITYYLYVESENRPNGSTAGGNAAGDSSDAVTIPDSGTSQYVFNSSTQSWRPSYQTYKDIGPGIQDEIHIVKYNAVPAETLTVTRWLIATVRRNGAGGPLEVRQKHLGALFLPGDSTMINPITDFSVTLL